jgi:hypothetical protein
MNRTSRSKRCADAARRRNLYRPRLELLEARLPLGDALLGVALGASLAGAFALPGPGKELSPGARGQKRMASPGVSVREMEAAPNRRAVGDLQSPREQPGTAAGYSPVGTTEAASAVSPSDGTPADLDEFAMAVAFAWFFPRVQRPRPMTLSSSHLAERLLPAVPQEPVFLVSAGSTPAAQRATELTVGSSRSAAKLAGVPDGSAESHPSSDGQTLRPPRD